MLTNRVKLLSKENDSYAIIKVIQKKQPLLNIIRLRILS